MLFGVQKRRFWFKCPRWSNWTGVLQLARELPMNSDHKKKQRAKYFTTDSQRALFALAVTFLVSSIFLGIGYFFLMYDSSQWQIFGYIFLVWGAMGICYSLVELLKTLK
jgi:hypothetical protein